MGSRTCCSPWITKREAGGRLFFFALSLTCSLVHRRTLISSGKSGRDVLLRACVEFLVDSPEDFGQMELTGALLGDLCCGFLPSAVEVSFFFQVAEGQWCSTLHDGRADLLFGRLGLNVCG